MIRITTAADAACTSITVDVTLSNKTVELVQTCCTEALAKGKPVRLHLRDICAIDEPGRPSSHVVDEIQSTSGNKRRQLC